jgi:hypothetical protein
MVTLRRKAAGDYIFSDVVEVKSGTTIHTPLRAMGLDPAISLSLKDSMGIDSSTLSKPR